MREVASSILICAVAALAPAQPEEAIDLAGRVDLARLVDVAAERLDLSIDYDASALTGTVTLRLGESISDDELWLLVNRLLATKGLTTVSAGREDALSVVKIAEAPRLARLGEEESRLPPGFRFVVRRIEHADVASILKALGPLAGEEGAVSRLGETNLLLLADLAPRVQRYVNLIDRLDTPDAETRLVQVPLAHLGAAEMTTLIGQVRAKAATVGQQRQRGEVLPAPDGRSLLVIAPESDLQLWRDLIESLDQREPVETRTYSARYFGVDAVAELVTASIDAAGDERTKILADQLTGTLVVTASDSVHERVREIIGRLDSVTPEGRRQVRTIVVNNRSVVDLIEVVRGLTEAGVITAGAETADVGPPKAESGETPQTSLGRPQADDARPDLTMSADERTSSIIAMGPPRLLDELESLIRRLDVRQPQVMLEVVMVSLTDNESRELGVELQGQFELGATSVSLASLFGLGAPLLGRADDGDDERGSGLTGLVLKPGDFSVLLRALETLSDGRTLTMPRALVTNNEEAQLDSVNQQPTTAINASQTVSTTSFSGFQSAGTQITLRPQIAEGDHIVLEYTVSLSSFDGESTEAGVPPPRNENRIQSIATIPDGYTVVVGGIDVETEGRAESRVPIIGAIPIIGEAFKSRSRSKRHAKFYAFIRPTVLRHQTFEDLKFMSDRDLSDAAVDDGWPEVAPRVIR